LIDLTKDTPEKIGYTITEGEDFAGLQEWKLASTEKHSFNLVESNKLIVRQQNKKIAEHQLNQAKFRSNWGNKGVCLILNVLNLSLFYVDYQKFHNMDLNVSFQQDLSKFLKGRISAS
jgi:hypothetical protein